jgi:ammonia channel protein AmtB
MGASERKRFKAFVLFGLLWATFVYDPIAHWVWGTGGWLHNLGALDCAGGICFFGVHFVKECFAVDDALDVVGVHGVGTPPARSRRTGGKRRAE